MTAAYRIEVQRNLHLRDWPWEATIFPSEGTLADFPATVTRGKTRGEALDKAREWILDERAHRVDADTNHETLYVDERGEQVQP